MAYSLLCRWVALPQTTGYFLWQFGCCHSLAFGCSFYFGRLRRGEHLPDVAVRMLIRSRVEVGESDGSCIQKVGYYCRYYYSDSCFGRVGGGRARGFRLAGVSACRIVYRPGHWLRFGRFCVWGFARYTITTRYRRKADGAVRPVFCLLKFANFSSRAR